MLGSPQVSPFQRGEDMSVAGDIKKDLAFLRGVFGALRVVTPMARNKTRTFSDVAEDLAKKFGDRPALLSDRETLTYRRLSPAAPTAMPAGRWRTASRRATSSA